MKYLVLALISFQLVGCASYFKRKQCEKVNWFEYGEKLALDGKWINSDQLVNECRKAEADIAESQLDQGFKRGRQTYCTPEQARITGRKGEVFAKDLCDGGALGVALSRYQEGLKQYCAKSNGFHAGQSGVAYKNVCPENLEPAFLVEYKKGRSVYLQNLIQSDEKDLQKLRGELPGLEASISNLRTHESSLESQLTTARSLVDMTSDSNAPLKRTLQGQVDSIEKNLRNVRNQRQSVESERHQKSQKAEQLDENVRKLKQELAQLQTL